jgi:Fe-S cluster assembly protein SufD
MEKLQEAKEWYLAQFESFEKKLNGESKLPIHQFRKSAVAKLAELQFPTIKDEEWKYTDLLPLLQHKFNPAIAAPVEVSRKQIEPFLFNHAEYNTLVFVNGAFREKLSNIIDGDDKFVVLPLRAAFETQQEIIKKFLGKNVEQKQYIFPELNAAFLQDGAFVLIKKNAVLAHPVHILYVSASDEELAIQPRNLFILEENAQASLIENYETISGSSSFTNAVSEVFLGKSANLSHVRIQNESRNSFHVSLSEAVLDQASVYTYHNVDLGGKMARNNFHIRFAAGEAECHLNGLYLVKDEQLIDNHTLIDHAKANCRSNELYKGVLTGKSRAVFNGKVLVRKDAQKTNAFQSNKNILLSDNALVDTKPQLEIFADDVKCSHGATIGQLDEESLFYLRSRGLSYEQARNILIFAFAKNVVETIKHEEVLAYIENKIHEQLG